MPTRADVTVIPAPWRTSDGPRFDGLSDEHSLERVLIDGILAVRPAEHPLSRWAADATESLRALEREHGNKRAFRIWNAALFPDSESFVARLLEAEETKRECLASLFATPAGAALRALLGR